MGTMKCTTLQAQTLLNARSKPIYERKQIKKRVFAEIRKEHGIPSGTKFKMFVESEDNPLYCVLRNKHTGKPLDNGIPEKVEAPVKLQVQESPAAKPPVAKPVKVAKPVAKAPAKPVAKAPKPVAKAPAKPVAKAPAKAPVKAPAKKPAASAQVSYPREVRPTLGGKRVRLGVAKDAAAEKRMIAKYKKENGLA